MKRQKIQTEDGTIKYKAVTGASNRGATVICGLCGKAMAKRHLKDHFDRKDHQGHSPFTMKDGAKPAKEPPGFHEKLVEQGLADKKVKSFQEWGHCDQAKTIKKQAHEIKLLKMKLEHKDKKMLDKEKQLQNMKTKLAQAKGDLER